MRKLPRLGNQYVAVKMRHLEVGDNVVESLRSENVQRDIAVTGRRHCRSGGVALMALGCWRVVTGSRPPVTTRGLRRRLRRRKNMHALLNGACDSEWRVGALAKLDSRVRGNDGLAVLMSPAYGSSLARSVAEPFGKELWHEC